MKDVTTTKSGNFIDFMGKVEKVGFVLLNSESVMKDSRQQLSIPKPFKGLMNSQNLV